MRARFIKFIVIIQLILFAAHGFVYETWIAFQSRPDPSGVTGLQVAMVVLSLTFVPASLLGFRYSNFWTKLFYKLSAVWLGMMNFFVLAAFLCWMAYLGERVFGLPAGRPALAESMYGLAIFTSFCGMINARRVRLKRIKVKLPNLPPSWRGRRAALLSDLHLGHVNGRGFIRRIIARIAHLQPEVVFIAGDLFDGAHVSAGNLAAEWKQISPALGSWFVTGNHEEFSDPTKYLDTISNAGIRVLNNERVALDGLDIVGVPYHDSARPERLRSVLQGAGLDRDRASILLAHAPHALGIAEKEGVSLQLSGHTHGGQLFPFTLLIRRVFREYAYGLNQFGNLMVYTSSGCGTWGPPMRVGTCPEIVLIEFE
ncbi:MAG: metallophosphoesterase [Acidobacteriota bacterium]